MGWQHQICVQGPASSLLTEVGVVCCLRPPLPHPCVKGWLLKYPIIKEQEEEKKELPPRPLPQGGSL